MTRNNSKQPPLHPRYWPGWVALGLLRLMVFVPFPAQIVIGRWLGRLMRLVAGRRRRVAEHNLRLCFPEKPEAERERLLREHFEDLGIALFEIAMCWWASERRLRGLAEIEGLEHLDTARKQGRGAILLSAHFTTLEIGGRLLSLYRPFHIVYRPNRDELLEWISRRQRERQFEKAIRRDGIREMIRSLQENIPVWYAPDQGYVGKNSVTVPFFGVPAPTNPATSRLAKITGAPVLTYWVRRLPGARGYRLRIDPPVEGMADMSLEEDARTVNALIEAEARENTSQYLWTHNRFKTVEHRRHERRGKREAERKGQNGL
jgi:Kdo2-lipid IVA lauroyltransferase/acyltransferase